MHKQTMSSTSRRSKRFPLRLLAAAIGFCPVVAGAGTLGTGDTATGAGALASENGGSYNTADGYLALTSNTSGTNNNASGAGALISNTIGSNNVASGLYALRYNSSGTDNTAVGFQALYNAVNSYNVAVGSGGLGVLSLGSNNVGIGFDALAVLSGGNGNIALGASAGKYTQSGNGDIYIGNPGINGSESKVMRIGKAQTKTFIAGIAGVPLSGATVVIKPNGQLGIVASSARYKKDIRSLDDASDKLAQLRPVSFRYKSEPKATHYGLIAEEVDRVMPELVVRDEKNRPESVQYQELIPLLLQQWKAQQAEIARQEAEIADLRRVLATRFAGLGASAKGSGVKLPLTRSPAASPRAKTSGD